MSSFQTVNLFASYKLSEQGALAGTTISVHVDNVFDTDPSYRNSANGFGNGSTFGRFASLTVEKKF